jgi:hypothetical protein
VSFEESYYEYKPRKNETLDIKKPYMRISTDVEVATVPRSVSTSANTSGFINNSVNNAATYRPSGQIRPFSPSTDRKWPNLTDTSSSEYSGIVPTLFTPMPYKSQRDNLRSQSDWTLSPKTNRSNRERFFDIDFDSYDNSKSNNLQETNSQYGGGGSGSPSNRARSASAFEAKITTIDKEVDNFTQQMNTIGVTPREVVNQTTTTKTLKNLDMNNKSLSKIDMIDLDFNQHSAALPTEKKASYRIRTESAVEKAPNNTNSNITNNVAVRATTTNPSGGGGGKANLPGVRFKSDIEVFSNQFAPPPKIKDNTYDYVFKPDDIIKSSIKNGNKSTTTKTTLPINVIDVDFSVYEETTVRNTNANRYTATTTSTTNNNPDRKTASVVKIVS